MTEAALSYIGLGLSGGIPDWGMDLSMGKKFLPSGVWWMITFPGVMIMTLALGFTMLGEGVITSYSIHYTKLYEPRVWELMMTPLKPSFVWPRSISCTAERGSCGATAVRPV